MEYRKCYRYEEFIFVPNEIDEENTGLCFYNMFYKCSSLKSLPNISKWKIDNITNANGLFYGCSSLISIPDISNWKTDNVVNMGYLFASCSSLLSLPDISKWNVNNVKTMSILYFCRMFSSKRIT